MKGNKFNHPTGKKATNYRHGLCETPEYVAWMNARDRCNRKRNLYYKHYGGRGIKVKFTSFLDFLKEIGHKPSPAHSLDRIDNDGHYEKGNIRWATRTEQNENRSISQSETALMRWAKEK
jgi:hypothetical protein